MRLALRCLMLAGGSCRIVGAEITNVRWPSVGLAQKPSAPFVYPASRIWRSLAAGSYEYLVTARSIRSSPNSAFALAAAGGSLAINRSKAAFAAFGSEKANDF